jgi:hypothetical protein
MTEFENGILENTRRMNEIIRVPGNREYKAGLQVFAPGSKVKIAAAEDAVVTIVSVRTGGFVCYEVAWWNGNSRCTAWLEAFEVTPAAGTERMSLGFTA